jgi:hypothetical protein
MDVLMAKGARAYARALGIPRDGKEPWDGPTLRDGSLQVRPSPIGGGCGRGLFQARGTAMPGTCILYGGQRITGAEATKRRASNDADWIVQLTYRSDEPRLDGKTVADAIALTANTEGFCEALYDWVLDAGPAALINERRQGRPNCKLTWIGKDGVGWPYVVAEVVEPVEEGTEFTILYGSKTARMPSVDSPRPQRAAAQRGVLKRLRGEDESSGVAVDWAALSSLTGVARERWVLVESDPPMARTEWSAAEAKADLHGFTRVSALPQFYCREAQVGAITWYLQLEGGWTRLGTAAESPGLRRIGIRGEMGWLWAFAGSGSRRLGRLRGVLIGETDSGSEEVGAIIAKARQSRYVFERILDNGRSQILDGAADCTGGMAFINDARNIVGASYNATVDKDSEVYLKAKASVKPLDGCAVSWLDLMRSEVFWDYGEAYWKVHGLPATPR